jgi:hypothetical protein
VLGYGLSGGAANARACRGFGSSASPIHGFRRCEFCILGPLNALTFVPKVGAQCGSSARWDLCGGWPVRAVPTATVLQQPASFRTAP